MGVLTAMDGTVLSQAKTNATNPNDVTLPVSVERLTGLCLDLITTEMGGLWNYGSETPNNPYDKGFAETEAFEWLCENAHKYGFILRYPETKTSVTGYSYESWHYRYVGVEHATKIHEREITLEEYLRTMQ